MKKFSLFIIFLTSVNLSLPAGDFQDKLGRQYTIDWNQKEWTNADQELLQSCFSCCTDKAEDLFEDPQQAITKDFFERSTTNRSFCVRAYLRQKKEFPFYPSTLIESPIALILFRKQNRWDNTLHLDYVCTLNKHIESSQEFRKQGIAKQLIESLAQRLQPCTIHLFSTFPAIRFYQKLNFTLLDNDQDEMIKDYEWSEN